MGGYTIDNGQSDASPPVVNVDGVNEFGTNGVNNGTPQTDVYLGPEDRYTSYNPQSGVLLHPNDVASFYLIAAGDEMNNRVEVGDAGTITIGGVNTSGTVYFNSYFNTLPTDGDGEIAGKSQTIYYSAAAGGTVVQNFQMITGLASEPCEASIDKVGPGTWVVAAGGTNNAGEQAYNGNTTVRDGTLELEYDDTGTNYVTLPTAAISAGAPYYQSGDDGGSLGYNAATNAVQLGDSGTLATDNIALLTLMNPGAPGPRAVLHNISVNKDNPSGSTTIGVGDNGTANYSGNIALSESVVLTGGSGGLANFSGNVTGTGAITVNGTGTVNLSGADSYNGGTNVKSGAALVIAAAGALPSGSAIVNNGSVTINGNSVAGNISGAGTLNIGTATPAVLQLAVGSGGSSQSALNISTGSTLDITNNHMFINYGSGPDPIASIASWIASGAYGSGTTVTWTGTGIISSNAQTNPTYGIGYADSADPGNPAHLSSGQIEIMYTLLGDANLDGKVNGTDFNLMATNFNQAVTAGWDKGDFNYDGKVNGNDFVLLASNFNQFASQSDVSSADQAALDSFAAANGISLANVPEPVSSVMIAMAGLVALRRRRPASNG
jgi:autotransporter-associated beta strand protein